MSTTETTIQNTVRRISHARLEQILAEQKGAKMCTIITETDVRMRKTNNPFHGLITKRQRMNVTINFIYANSVNRVRTKEGNEADFVPHERKWGVRRQGCSLIDHQGRVYLECKPNAGPQFQEFYHKVSGEITAKEVFEEFITPSRSSAALQGVSVANEVIVRDFQLDTITDLILGGVHYKVRR